MKFRVIKADYKSKYDCYFNGRKKDIQYYIVQYKKDPSFLDLLNMIGKLPNIMLNNWLKALSVKNLLLAVPRYVITIKIF